MSISLKEARALAHRGYGWEDLVVRDVPPLIAKLIVWGDGTDAQLSALWLRERAKDAWKASQRPATQAVLCDDPGGALALAGDAPLQADK